jgi:hypothetical protein
MGFLFFLIRMQLFFVLRHLWNFFYRIYLFFSCILMYALLSCRICLAASYFSFYRDPSCSNPPQHLGECKDAAPGSVEPQSYAGVAARQLVFSAPSESCLQDNDRRNLLVEREISESTWKEIVKNRLTMTDLKSN